MRSLITILFILITVAGYAQLSDFWEDSAPEMRTERDEGNLKSWGESRTDDDETETDIELWEDEPTRFFFLNHTLRSVVNISDDPVMFLPSKNHAYLQMISLQSLSRLAAKNQKDIRMINIIITESERKLNLEIEPMLEGEIEE